MDHDQQKNTAALREELYLLTEASLRGEISVAESQRLEELLGDPQILSCYVEYVLQSVSLGVWASALKESENTSPPPSHPILPLLDPSLLAGDGLSPDSGTQTNFSGMTTLFSESALGSWWSGWLTVPRLAAAAAVLIAAFSAWFWLDSSPEIMAERERQPVASLTAGGDARWQNGFKPNAGTTKLMEGQMLKLIEGRAQVNMSCGADLMLKSPCTIVLASPDQVLLREGLLSVQVADWASGFTVATDSVHIVDLGKQFVVSADAKTGAVEAHAIDGKLRVLASNGPDESRSGLLVSTGEAIRFLPASNTSSRLKANSSLFDPGLDDSRPFKPLPITNTGHGLVPGDEDPNWRIVASTANDFAGPQYAVACDTPGKDVYLPNDPNVSQWISTTNPVVENCQPNAAYTFETEFDLTGYDLSTITIVGHVLADNGVIGVRINGQPVPFSPWIDNLSKNVYKSFHKIEITEGFVNGVNRIQFDVWNGVNARHPKHTNAMALRVEWQAFGRLKPPDAPSTASIPRQWFDDFRQIGARSKPALPAFPRSASSFFLTTVLAFSN